MLKTDIKCDFLDLFYHVIKDYKLENQNKLNLFSLEIKNTMFNVDSLADELDDHIIPFILSRQQIENMGDKYGGKKSREARKRFRKYTSNEGELGEVLLYCFLEAHLKAPKILSKYELKTSNNDYIKGSDGVHLLKINETTHQLLFGESKLYGDLKGAIYKAFGSIIEFLEKKQDTFDESLINANLSKEAFKDEDYEMLKTILLPKKRVSSNISLDNAFGIFLGFDYNFDGTLKGDEARKKIKEEIEEIVLASIDSINNQLKKENLKGYDFYIYTMPINKIEETRKNMIERLVNG
ncbi:MAG: DUF1837 domain-containing protein [Halarcobacter sp.]